jgi:hypothetical protein
MTKIIYSGILGITLISLGYVSCTHESVIPSEPSGGILQPPGTTGRSCSPDTVYFANDIFPLIQSTCAMGGCHDNITREEDVDLTTYSKIAEHVIPGNALKSELYKEIIRTDEDRMPPPPMAPWTTDQINKLKTWINQGAKNNSCDACDTSKFTYAAAIKPIIQNKCQGCHNPGFMGGNVDLSTYQGLKSIATNGKLYGSITWTTGYSPMPRSMKLPACEIIQIKKWIDNGSLNN